MHSDAFERLLANKSRQGGLTLVELLTVMVVVAILASIAIPSYRRYLVRTNRSDAKTALMQLQAAQEKFYLQNNAYTDKVAEKSPTGLGLTTTTPNGYYNIAVTLGKDNQTYTASATPTSSGGQSADKECNIFTISDVGKRDVKSATKDSVFCWK